MAFRIVRNDITKMHVDAIVNTANPMPIIGGGTDSAIYKAAGEDLLLAEREKIGVLGRGEAAITPAFNLDAKYIIHTVGPRWMGGVNGEEEQLKNCYANSLRLAAEHGCESIAFPMISTGVYAYPREKAFQTAFSVVSKFLIDNEMMIYFVVFDEQTSAMSKKVFDDVEEEIDDEYANDKLESEYWGERRPSAYRREYFAEVEREAPCFESYDEPEDMMEDICCNSAPMPSSAPKASQSSRFEKASSIFKAKKPRSIDDVINNPAETFSQMLLRLIDEKGLSNAQAYTNANQTKQTFSKIKNDIYYQPKKKTVLAFALALELNMDQTRDLLMRAGYAFSPSNKQDMVVSYYIEREIYDIGKIEIALFDHNIEPLCFYPE